MAKNNIALTVFTPTYNRAHTLRRLYNSLTCQSSFDFEWIVVDDGSTDDTEDLITELSKRNKKFPIIYCKQSNGGKHRAINRGVKMAHGDYFIILDSDDWFSDNAIEIIKKRVSEIQHDDKFCGIAGLRVTPELETIGTECSYEILDTTFFNYRFKLRVNGDRAEVIKTNIMREYPFPEFENENFLGEAVIWNNIASKYETRFTNDRFYICEYQPGGLTDTFEKRMETNPLGAMLNQLSIITHKDCPLAFWLFANLNYWRYRGIAKSSKLIIPGSLAPTKKMKACILLNPMIRFLLRVYKNFK